MENTSTSETSITLLGRVQGSPTDQAAWSEFVNRYGPKINRWCRGWDLQEADAQDVTQNVLTKLAEKLRGFVYDPSQSFRGWLRTLTDHALVDFLEERQRHGRGSGDSQMLAILNQVEARASLAEQLKEEFDRELMETVVARVRRRVASQKWEAFRLTLVEGMSGAEAASALGMNVATVFTAKSKVLKLVREEIHKLEHPAQSLPARRPS